jgi:hypothetical protein
MDKAMTNDTAKHLFNVLTPQDVRVLRVERVRLIEEDLCRAFLQLEETQSDAEHQSVVSDIHVLRKRLLPHYQALGFASSDPEINSEESGGL